MSKDLQAQLRALLSVVRCGSMSAAARELDVSVPTVSRLITDLEAGLGTSVLERSNRRAGTMLTPEGLRVVRTACPILCATRELYGGPGAADPAQECPALPSFPCAGYGSCEGRQGGLVAAPPRGGRPLIGTVTSQATAGQATTTPRPPVPAAESPFPPRADPSTPRRRRRQGMIVSWE